MQRPLQREEEDVEFESSDSHSPRPEADDPYADLFATFPDLLKPELRPKDYQDPSPRPIEPIISLVEFFERVKRLKADPWQIDFCERLEQATINQHNESTRAAVHAEAQLGKSVILAQCFPAWLLGHNPQYRIALATYNVTRSQAHSAAVISIMNLPIYRDLFSGEGCGVRPNAAKSGWQTYGRETGTDPQLSYNPCGLQSGLTGSGFDCLTGETLIMTDRGQVRIDAVVRDIEAYRVLTCNHATGVLEGKQIVASKRRRVDDVLTLKTRKGRTIRGTADHRVWREGSGYVQMKEMRPGDVVKTPAEDRDEVESITMQEGASEWVYDIQVEGNHNFFADEILVHNCLIIDDPYADQKEAFSETIRTNLEDFWAFTVESRISLYSNVFAMFHRYHVQDLAGHLLDSGEFDYWRYASLCDGPYIHEETGQKFDDPLGRKIGEWISPRRPEEYYARNRKNSRVWNSMFQGRPTSEEGDFFNVGKIRHLEDEVEIETARQECSSFVRAWDNAATEDGGDLTAGALLGMRADGKVTVFDVVLAQVDSGARLQLQVETAEKDGKLVTVRIPQDPGASGKDTVFMTKQRLAGYTVEARPVSASKAARALNFSAAVNSGDVAFVKGDWTKDVLRSLRDFPLSDFDDPVDALSDAYNLAYEQYRRGPVIRNFNASRSVIDWNEFREVFNLGKDGVIPGTWTSYVGIKITPDASRANAAVIVVRPPVIEDLPDVLFMIAEYREYTSDFYRLFDWVEKTEGALLDKGSPKTAWLHPESEQFRDVIWQKITHPAALFKGDESAGVSELDWHLLPTASNKLRGGQPGSRFYLVVDPSQVEIARDAAGLAAMRQEVVTWGWSEKEKPQPSASVADCARMVTYAFRHHAVPLNAAQRVEMALDPQLRLESLALIDNSPEKDGLLMRRVVEMQKVESRASVADRGRPVRKSGGSGFFK